MGINGAAATCGPGPLVILAAYGWMTEEEAAARKPKVVFVDDRNRITSLADRERTPGPGLASQREADRGLPAPIPANFLIGLPIVPQSCKSVSPLARPGPGAPGNRATRFRRLLER